LEKETTGSGQAATGPGSSSGGWGPNQQFNFPFGGGYGGVPYGWQGYPMMYPGSMMQPGVMQSPGAGQSLPSGSSGGNQAGGSGSQPKRKHPCDNCGSMDHWKYQPVCPNYHIHLAQQEAKHQAFRQQATAAAGQGGQSAADKTVALIPRQGKSKIFI